MHWYHPKEATCQKRKKGAKNTVDEGGWVAPGIHNRYHTYYHTASIMVT